MISNFSDLVVAELFVFYGTVHVHIVTGADPGISVGGANPVGREVPTSNAGAFRQKCMRK